ncbi:SAM-dependent methyltransferase [Candidatus Rariloculus sp.]|uniref:SAM-dependent methyltransferase n=1 Tax=Candidatus Rariloculus sp. TaxID=3101265 RepID=UPI003D0AAA62
MKSVSVPLGRSYDEYVEMFALTSTELCGRILGCADGPASFNAIHSSNGGRVVSIDPLYDFSAEQIRDRIGETFPEAMHQVRLNESEFVWDRIRSVDELAHVRMQAMNRFLDDYPQGKSDGRYIPRGLPNLPFAEREFDLALCSHYLFLYSAQLSTAYHIRSIRELCRVAAEVRIFPLLELGSVASRHLDAVMANLRGSGHECSVHAVPYEFQRGGNSMLRVN